MKRKFILSGIALVFAFSLASAQPNTMAITGRKAGPHAGMKHGHFQDNLTHREDANLEKNIRRVLVGKKLANCDKKARFGAKVFLSREQGRHHREINREMRAMK